MKMSTRGPVTRLHLDKEGLNLFLGSVETSVLAAVWDGASTVSDVYRHILTEETNLAYTTIKTVVDRLVDKGLLVKHRPVEPSKAPTYTPAYSDEEAYIVACIRHTLTRLQEEFTDEYTAAKTPTSGL